MLINNEKDVLFSSSEGINCIKAYLQQRGLSKRESEVVILVVQGLTNKQVADRLCVAEKTVKFHLTNVYKRMKISRRSEIIWSLPLAEFMEKAKTRETNIGNPSFSPSISGEGGEPPIPVGSSTVTDY